MNLKEKLHWLRDQSDEFALGWNDSGCFWHFCWGPRGAGNMMEGFGNCFAPCDCEDLEEAVDALIAYRGLTLPEPPADLQLWKDKKRGIKEAP